MSDIQLSPTLMANVQSAIVAADSEAEDAGVALQYMAAVMSYFLGMQDMPRAEKDEYLDNLHEFSKQVLDDVCKPKAPAVPAQNAYGIWEPAK